MNPPREAPPIEAESEALAEGQEPQAPLAGADSGAYGEEGADSVEEVDGLPVLSSRRVAALRGPVRALARDREAGSLPTVQAAAVAAGSFVAGAAVAGLVHRHARRSPALARGGRVGKALSRGSRKAAGAGSGARAGNELVQIVGSRTFLVDVHLLGIPDLDG
jgi:hypothetical protein